MDMYYPGFVFVVKDLDNTYKSILGKYAVLYSFINQPTFLVTRDCNQELGGLSPKPRKNKYLHPRCSRDIDELLWDLVSRPLGIKV